MLVLVENGASAAALENANIKSADMLIAVTDLDEVNIIACILAKQYGVSRTVCRLRNPEHIDEDIGLNPRRLGIDTVINPEQVAAMEISKMIHFPDFSEIEYFTGGKVMMLGVKVGEEAEITGVPINKLPGQTDSIIVGISRPNGKFIIPGGRDIIEPGSKIYLLGKIKSLKDISKLLHHEETRVNRVAILGGGLIGQQVALLLEESKQPFTVKLIEKDVKRCEELSIKLNKTMVLHGDATEIAMLEEEDMETNDAVIAAAGDDHTNIVVALLAHQFGVKKIICEVMEQQHVPIYNALGIDNLINPRLLVAAQIIHLTRREEVVALSILQSEKAEVFELVLPETAKAAHKKIGEVRFPHGMLIGSILRKEEVIIPNGTTVLLPKDHLVIFSLPKIVSTLDRFFAP